LKLIDCKEALPRRPAIGLIFQERTSSKIEIICQYTHTPKGDRRWIRFFLRWEKRKFFFRKQMSKLFEEKFVENDVPKSEFD